MSRKEHNSLFEEFRIVIKDGIDYLQAQLALLQARTAEFALSGILFIVLIGLAVMLGTAAFIFFNIALGYWLTSLLGSAMYSITLLGTFYAILAIVAISIALHWLKTLKS